MTPSTVGRPAPTIRDLHPGIYIPAVAFGMTAFGIVLQVTAAGALHS